MSGGARHRPSSGDLRPRVLASSSRDGHGFAFADHRIRNRPDPRTAALVDRFADLSVEPVSQEQVTLAALKKHLNAEVAKWAPIIKAAGLCAD